VGSLIARFERRALRRCSHANLAAVSSVSLVMLMSPLPYVSGLPPARSRLRYSLACCVELKRFHKGPFLKKSKTYCSLTALFSRQ